MKVLLIDPQWQRTEIGPKMAMGCLAASIIDVADVDVLEFHLDAEELQEISEKPYIFWHKEHTFLKAIVYQLETDNSIGVVAVTGWSGAFPRMLRVASVCRSIRPDVKVVFGGPHTTLHERYTSVNMSILSKNKDVDFLAVGEGEVSFRNFIIAISNINCDYSQINGLVWRNRENVIRNECKFHLFDDLSSISPNWEPFTHRKNSMRRLLFFVESSRGCPYQCSFCDETDLWMGYRNRGVTSVVNDVEKGISDFGTRSFRFTDSTATANANFWKTCKEICRRNLGVSWSTFARASEITEVNANLLAEAGCKSLLIGIESGSQRVLDLMNKKTSIETVTKAVNILKKRKIKIRGSFIIGFPGETKEDVLKTISFARRLTLDYYAWHAYQKPFRALIESNQSDTDFDHYELDAPVEVYTQILEKEPSLLREMHTLPKLASMRQPIRPLPEKWPTERKEILDYLKMAISETSESREHDLDLLIKLAKNQTPPDILETDMSYEPAPIEEISVNATL